jgi:hypothetical protein
VIPIPHIGSDPHTIPGIAPDGPSITPTLLDNGPPSTRSCP